MNIEERQKDLFRGVEAGWSSHNEVVETYGLGGSCSMKLIADVEPKTWCGIISTLNQ